MTKRLEDPRLLRGEAEYVSDIARPDMLHLAFFRSPYAHAVLRRLDVAAARACPGVIAVYTPEDMAHTRPIPASETPQPDFQRALRLELHDPPIDLLPRERLRYAGEPVAAVVAESRAAAEDAIELIELDAEPLPAVGGETALTGPELYPEVPGNVAISMGFERGDRPQPGDVAHVVRERFYSCRQGASPMEGRGCLADAGPTPGRMTMWTSTQVPHRVRGTTAAVLGWDESRIRVITPDVGGGFGMKANVAAEEIMVAFAADKLGRPVRWIADRTEDLLSAVQARDQVHDVELAVAADGRILSFSDEFIVDLGAYSGRAIGIIANTVLHAFGAYRMPHLRSSGRAVVSNKPPTSQYRGAGRPEVCFALELALDRAAKAIGIDPFEIRRRNMIEPAEMPYAQHIPQRDGVPISYDASDYPNVLRKAIDLAELADKPAVGPDEVLGAGCATYVEASGKGPFEGARVRVEPDGRVSIIIGSAGSGQGHATSLAKICASVLGVPLESIALTEGDTDLMLQGVGTFASRTAVVAGNAIHEASLQVREQALAAAADRLKVPPTDLQWEAAAAHAPDGRSVSLAELAAANSQFPIPNSKFLDVEFHFRPDTVTWTMGAHVALVAVDSETGGVRIVRYVSVHEGGPSLDETIVEGQMHGGIVQGISGGMLEEIPFGEEGQPQALSMADYLIAGAVEVPDMRLGHVFARGSNPLGIKGVGESGCVPAAATLANAISAALGGAALNATPLKPDSVWRAALG